MPMRTGIPFQKRSQNAAGTYCFHPVIGKKEEIRARFGLATRWLLHSWVHRMPRRLLTETPIHRSRRKFRIEASVHTLLWSRRCRHPRAKGERCHISFPPSFGASVSIWGAFLDDIVDSLDIGVWANHHAGCKRLHTSESAPQIPHRRPKPPQFLQVQRQVLWKLTEFNLVASVSIAQVGLRSVPVCDGSTARRDLRRASLKAKTIRTLMFVKARLRVEREQSKKHEVQKRKLITRRNGRNGFDERNPSVSHSQNFHRQTARPWPENGCFFDGRSVKRTVPPDADKTKKPRDNVFNTSVQKLFLLAMGLGKKGSTLKDAALLKPLTAGGGYIRDTETSNGKLLHPDWSVTFTDNSVWHSRVVKWMWQTMKTEFPAATIDQKSDDTILDQLSTGFRNIFQAYNSLQREKKAKKKAKDSTLPEDDADSPTENEMSDDAATRRAGRRKSCKTCKCDKRIMVLQNAGIQLHHHYAFFNWHTNPRTNEAGEAVHHVLWILILFHFNREVEAVKHYVLNHRTEQERKNGPAQSAPHPYILGDWKDTPLPRLGATKLRILHPCIHPPWLADNNDQEEEVESQGVEGADKDADDERD
ncbi:hypothetical protein DFH08DRAFT_943657 [Mycena albidolilacea]|uniref:Uncharacterized protein n=1 Tax=Mycena albidolilacea TaxID=1033008 RepID=A0AAD7ECE5_9AGAR|nr:hypothetical protein DFH08DRAFT_943657 [Mycena albidolilacea]